MSKESESNPPQDLRKSLAELIEKSARLRQSSIPLKEKLDWIEEELSRVARALEPDAKASSGKKR